MVGRFRRSRGLPSVACGVDGGEGDTAVEDLEEGLVLEHELSSDARGHRLREADYSIVIDDGTGVEGDGRGQDNAHCCEELDWEAP